MKKLPDSTFLTSIFHLQLSILIGLITGFLIFVVFSPSRFI